MPKTTHILKTKYFQNSDATTGFTKLEVGLDETGKGCYLGRVYAGAVFWDDEMSSALIRDSKELTARQRLISYDYIKENAPAYGFGWSEVEEIDTINIGQASIQAMYRALKSCQIDPVHIILDGDEKAFKKFSFADSNGKTISYSTIEKGDTLYHSIAAASIVSKVERDQYIERLCDENSYLDLYKIRSNKGYGAKQHEEAMAHWGVTKFHRMSYEPCRRFSHIVNTFE